jgi:hypothetical protein
MLRLTRQNNKLLTKINTAPDNTLERKKNNTELAKPDSTAYIPLLKAIC